MPTARTAPPRPTGSPNCAPDFTIRPSGPFSLAEAATFGFGQRLAPRYDGVMRMAFCLDGYRQSVGVEVRQDDRGVHVWMQGDADPAAVEAQTARVLSLDQDGNEFVAVGRRDPVIAALQAVAPGLRPPLFYSPYEAAAWAVLSARRPASQMSRVRAHLSAAWGSGFDLAGQSMAAFPTPAQLLEVASFDGIPERKMHRLHGIACAALDGRLDASTLRAAPLDEAGRDLRRLDGIGPFYASLVLIRATGRADILPVGEPKLLALVTRLYRLDSTPTPQELDAIAEPWRPLRTWAAVLIRAAAGRS